ncbi:hypothetical protein E3N88_19465 [Mikania micrantha]|uniref:Uncharacterized protein n=1 Tax=Mikania micrantha TaxID=192012 RepID=A0A5N6NPM6_9ASTR|nr:hypothetical protein E3N88_19465 [Mikania micrantha]
MHAIHEVPKGKSKEGIMQKGNVWKEKQASSSKHTIVEMSNRFVILDDQGKELEEEADKPNLENELKEQITTSEKKWYRTQVNTLTKYYYDHLNAAEKGAVLDYITMKKELSKRVLSQWNKLMRHYCRDMSNIYNIPNGKQKPKKHDRMGTWRNKEDYDAIQHVWNKIVAVKLKQKRMVWQSLRRRRPHLWIWRPPKIGMMTCLLVGGSHDSDGLGLALKGQPRSTEKDTAATDIGKGLSNRGFGGVASASRPNNEDKVISHVEGGETSIGILEHSINGIIPIDSAPTATRLPHSVKYSAYLERIIPVLNGGHQLTIFRCDSNRLTPKLTPPSSGSEAPMKNKTPPTLNFGAPEADDVALTKQLGFIMGIQVDPYVSPTTMQLEWMGGMGLDGGEETGGEAAGAEVDDQETRNGLTEWKGCH